MECEVNEAIDLFNILHGGTSHLATSLSIATPSRTYPQTVFNYILDRQSGWQATSHGKHLIY